MLDDDIWHANHPEDSFMSNMNATHNTHVLKSFLENHVNKMHPRGLDMSMDQSSVLSNDSTSHDVNQTVLVHNILELLRNHSQNDLTVEQIGDDETVPSEPVTNNSSSFRDINSTQKINVDSTEDSKIAHSADDHKEFLLQSNRFGFRTG